MPISWVRCQLLKLMPSSPSPTSHQLLPSSPPPLTHLPQCQLGRLVRGREARAHPGRPQGAESWGECVASCLSLSFHHSEASWEHSLEPRSSHVAQGWGLGFCPGGTLSLSRFFPCPPHPTPGVTPREPTPSCARGFWVRASQPAPGHGSPSSCPQSSPPLGFQVGMKLEAVDRMNPSLVCVASVTDVVDSRFLVHFDNWDDTYDYW